MKFLKTIDLYASGIQTALYEGQLKLQKGQWCVCGDNDKPCRFIEASKHSINVVHWQGSPEATTALFRLRVAALSLSRATDIPPAERQARLRKLNINYQARQRQLSTY
jgi:hypothetical protein